MKLNLKELEKNEVWEKANIKLPKFNIKKVNEDTYKNPIWIHFGAGNIFRAFPAVVVQKLLNEGVMDKGIIAAFTMDQEIVTKVFKPFDNLTLAVTLKANGEIEKEVVASVTESLYADKENNKDWDRTKEIFENQSLQIVSYTITEKGYSDFSDNGAMAKLTTLLHYRYQKSSLPLAVISMDNCSKNGDKIAYAVKYFAEKMVREKKAEQEFISYITDESKVSFPLTMIDKITPRPSNEVAKMLNECGFLDTEVIMTSGNTFGSTFVNAEEAEYLIIEDKFPNNKPNLLKGGIIFTDRETVNKVEKMKVGTCLNPLHTALAIFGCILNYEFIWQEMQNEDIVRLISVLGYKEGMPVVTDPKIIEPKQFIDEVIKNRLPNPFIPDSPFRIAMDTSQKIPVRFGETIKAYIKNDNLDVKNLEAIPIIFAGWCRYLMGVDDEGDRFELSSDPMLDRLTEHIKEIKLGMKGPFYKQLKPILEDEKIFGVNLYHTPIAKKVENYFEQMVERKGAVKKLLKNFKYI